MLVTTDLGEDGIEYLRALFKSGAHLAKALANKRVESGHVWTWLPQGQTQKTVNLFTGWPAPENPENPGKPMIELILRYLRKPNSLVVWELGQFSHTVADVFDAEAVKYFTAVESNEHELQTGESPAPNVVQVYGYVDGAEATKERIQQLLSDRKPFGSLGVLSTIRGEPLCNREAYDPQIFVQIAAETQFILNSAFDDEGWVVWAPSMPGHDFESMNSSAASTYTE
jgi:hypothetical protein